MGRHIPVSPGAVPRFLNRFEQVYTRLGSADRIIAAATAHQRLLWIHPFADGNGRMARFTSYAMLRDGLDTGGLWSTSRGLARAELDYKSHLANCGQPRRNDLDGRGTLSEEALVAFARFFLEVSIDQVDFMTGLIEPEMLRGRILRWSEDEIRAGRLPLRASMVLEALLFRGELARVEVPELLATSERHARRVTSALRSASVLYAKTTRAPFRLAFPASLADRWMPGLFPSKPE
ncbi:MAG: Fic family protein [Myxococcota bacterium]